MIGHYLFNFVVMTGGVIAFLYLVYLYLRQNPHLGQSLQGKNNLSRKGLQVESVLNLEPRKNLYVIRCGKQRFLVATTVDKTELPSTLKPETREDEAVQEASLTENPIPLAAVNPNAGWVERFRTSFKLVVLDRLMPTGGK